MQSRTDELDSVDVARLLVQRMLTLLARGHVVSAPHAAAVLTGVGDSAASYDVVALDVPAVIARFRSETVVDAVIARGGTGAARVHSRSLDFWYRPPELRAWPAYLYASLTRRVTLARPELNGADDGSYVLRYAARRLVPDRNAGDDDNAYAVCIRRVPACPQIIGRIPAATDERECARWIHALFAPASAAAPMDLAIFDSYEAATRLLAAAPWAKQIWQNLRALRDVPHRAPPHIDDVVEPAAEVADRDDLECEPPSRYAEVAQRVCEYRPVSDACVAPVISAPEAAPRGPARERAPTERDGDIRRNEICASGPPHVRDEGGVAVRVQQAIDAAARNIRVPFNGEQRRIASIVGNALVTDTPTTAILCGGAGTGKSTSLALVIGTMAQLGLPMTAAVGLAYTNTACVALRELGINADTTSHYFAINTGQRGDGDIDDGEGDAALGAGSGRGGARGARGRGRGRTRAGRVPRYARSTGEPPRADTLNSSPEAFRRVMLALAGVLVVLLDEFSFLSSGHLGACGERLRQARCHG